MQWLFQGLIEEEKLDSFNIPQYTPSPAEVKYLVEEEGSFTISRLEATTVHWNAAEETFGDGGYNVSQCMRAVAEPLLVSHFGEAIIDEVFSKYTEILTECMSKEKTAFVNVTVSIKKRWWKNDFIIWLAQQKKK